MMRRSPNDQVAYAIAEKQLYSSHYFETALDLSFYVRRSDDPAKPGFYLIAIPVFLPAAHLSQVTDPKKPQSWSVSQTIGNRKARQPRKEEH
jgi:hypothetical protein